MSQRLWAIAERAVSRDVRGTDGKVRRRVLYPTYLLRLLMQVLRQWRRDRAPHLAAALSFQTALSLVPLIAAALALIHAAGAAEIEEALVQFLAERLAPVGADEVASHLREWIANVQFGTAGLLGIAVLIVLGYMTVMRVEEIFNDIWRSTRPRRLVQSFVVFYVLITLVPALFGVSLYVAARSGFTQGPLGAVVALGATFVAFALANKLLPAAKVKWKSAIIAGLVSALLFELAKLAFSAYVVNVAFARYMGIYGPLALLPILLLWVYYTWLVVLFGAEVAYAMQHLPELELYDRRGDRLEADIARKVNGQVATRLMAAIAAGWREGRPRTHDQLARRFGLPPEAADRLLDRLRDAHLVLEVAVGDDTGYLPARPPAEITLADVFAPFRDGDVIREAARAASDDPLDRTLDDLDMARQARLTGIALADVVPTEPDPVLDAPPPAAAASTKPSST